MSLEIIPPSPVVPSRKENWQWSWLLFSCIVFGIPLVLLNFGIRQTWRESLALHQVQIELQLEQTLSGLEARGDTHGYLTRLLGELVRKANSSQDPLRFYATWIPRLKTRFPGVFETTVLDGAGTAVSTLCDVPPPRMLLQRYFSAYRDLLSGNPEPLERESRLIRNFLGPLLPLGRAIHGRITLAGTSSHRRYVYLSPPTPKGMLIVHLSPGADWLELGIREEIKRVRQTRNPIRVGLFNLKYPVTHVLANLGVPQTHGKTLWRLLSQAPKGVVSFGGAVFAVRQIRPSLLIVGRTHDLRSAAHQPAERRLAVLTIALFVLLMGSVFPWFSGAVSIACSVRLRLVFAFLFAAGLPLVVMAVTARSWLADRQKTLESARHAAVEKALRDFDGRFPHLVGMLERRVVREFHTYRHPAGKPVLNLARHLETVRRTSAWDSCRIYDRSGQTVFERSIPELSGKSGGLFGMLDKVASRMLSHLDLDGDSEGKPPAQETSPHADIEFERAFSSVSTQLGRITSFDAGSERYFTAMYPVYDSVDRAVFFVLLFWGRDQLEQEYVKKKLAGFSRQLDETSVWAVSRRNPEIGYPTVFRHAERGIPFLKKVMSSEQGTRSRLVHDGEPLLLTGLRGRELGGWNFVAVGGERTIRLDLDRSAWNYAWVACLVFLLSGCTGVFLARLFIDPVKDLAGGIEALARRDFEARVPVRHGDEFGDLADGFNQMMEGLADLETARTIQETLFPQKPLSGGAWQVFGTCRSAAQIGGNYVDYVALPGDRIAVAIGNVSGHGVSAALGMAMAKAVIAHPGTGADPARVLQLTQNSIAGLAGWKQGMDLLYGVLDVGSGMFAFAFNGENPPILVRSGAAIQQPPGEETVTTVQLRPGDLVFLFTPGLLSALDRSGKPLGKGRLLAALPALKAADAMASQQAVRAWFTTVVAPGPLADDVSMLLIQHVPGGVG